MRFPFKKASPIALKTNKHSYHTKFLASKRNVKPGKSAGQENFMRSSMFSQTGRGGIEMNPKTFIVFCSPAGATRHVADVIGRELNRLRADVLSFDLGRERDWSGVQKVIASAAEGACLFIGSPVYRAFAIPPVMTFIQTLSKVQQINAVPFVTWGAVSSGIALWQMGKSLEDKGFCISGAIKVVGFHSLMFESNEPLGEGRPSAEDDQVVKQFARAIHKGLIHDSIIPLQLDDLDYQPQERASEKKAGLTSPWKVTPKMVDEEKCTQCGICQQECPAGTITLTPYPNYGKNCFDCFNCKRLCPEEAIQSTADQITRAAQIRKLAKTLRERPYTQTYIRSTLAVRGS
jgi:ferredoxin